MTTAAPEIEQATDEQEETAAESGTKGLFKWSQYVHVGDGAQECPNGTNGKCQDEDHFHAWVRLPNQFQMRDITEKATAAKARRVRTLRDPESDARVILEEELDRLRDPALKVAVIDEILDKDFQETYVEAVREVDDIDGDTPELESEDEEPVKKYATIDQDREEYFRLKELPEEERGEDFEKLEAWVEQHNREVREAHQRIMRQKREPLESRDLEELIEIIRRDRIELQGSEAYLNAFNTWQWYACTYKPVAKGRPRERVFSSYNEMRFEADSEVIETLNLVFDDLRLRLSHSRAVKKS